MLEVFRPGYLAGSVPAYGYLNLSRRKSAAIVDNSQVAYPTVVRLDGYLGCAGVQRVLN